jgi:hypothetical protein
MYLISYAYVIPQYDAFFFSEAPPSGPSHPLQLLNATKKTSTLKSIHLIVNQEPA